MSSNRGVTSTQAQGDCSHELTIEHKPSVHGERAGPQGANAPRITLLGGRVGSSLLGPNGPRPPAGTAWSPETVVASQRLTAGGQGDTSRRRAGKSGSLWGQEASGRKCGSRGRPRSALPSSGAMTCALRSLKGMGHPLEGRCHRPCPVGAFRADRGQPPHRCPPPTAPPWRPLARERPVQALRPAPLPHLSPQECPIVAPLGAADQCTGPQERLDLWRSLPSPEALLSHH